MKPNAPQPPHRVPVLTEVVVLPQAQPVTEVDEFPPIPSAADPAFAQTAPTPMGGPEVPTSPISLSVPLHTSPPARRPMSAATSVTRAAPVILDAPQLVDETRVVQRVLADLDKQLDLMFEHRLRESLSPLLARMTDSLVREMRSQLAADLREMVSRAVSLELDRLQKR